MISDHEQPEGNEPAGVQPVTLQVAMESTTAAPSSDEQDHPIPIPRGFERLGAPVRLTDQARAYLITLPLPGTNQVANAIATAIDAGLPVTSIRLDVDLDREEGWDELAASLHVDQPSNEALRAWEDIEGQLFIARSRLDPGDRVKMEEGFALYVVWAPRDADI